jgi:hypothetical protein
MIHLTSFLLGIGAAFALPALSRVARPVLVEAAVAGMALFDETRRVVAEQMESIEDLAAEARARREDALVTTNGHHAGSEDLANGGDDAQPARSRRREGTIRRRTS